MFKARLQQKLLQKLSPQQIQMIKLLEVPTLQIWTTYKKMNSRKILPWEEEQRKTKFLLKQKRISFEENDKDKIRKNLQLMIILEEDEIPDYRPSGKKLQQGRWQKNRDTFLWLDFHSMSISNHNLDWEKSDWKTKNSRRVISSEISMKTDILEENFQT